MGDIDGEESCDQDFFLFSIIIWLMQLFLFVSYNISMRRKKETRGTTCLNTAMQ